ncbi:MAG TPA: hypothetical protein VGR62_16155 [Candidatus Binatia bacterium]|jgi:hypothetical protein|nr:hypothetical protein [Candidatus Binatia bacterium]
MGSRIALGIVCALLSSPRGSDVPQGEWHNTGIRTVEVLQDGTCLRVWLEERAYSFGSPTNGAVAGIYRNVVRAVPVGPPSFREGCVFPAPASNPVASQMRAWEFAAKPVDEGAWLVRAEPRPGSGDLRLFEAEEFQTKVRVRGDRLIDTPSSTDDTPRLSFRRPGAPPDGARAALDDAVTRLHQGKCLEVLSALGHDADRVTRVCDLRRRMDDLLGRYVSLSVDQAVELDAMPPEFNRGATSGPVARHGVFFAFIGQYEKERIPGNAVVAEEGGQWRVVALWF